MFCANDLSSFFFDIRKDCLYCDHKDDHKRKAYRMVLYTIFQHIVRRLAPIMVFTAEEAWLSLQINKESSVHIQTFIAAEKEWFNSDIFEKINKVKEVRRSITTAIEIARKDKKLGSSLQASIDLYDPDNILSVKDEALWEEIAITSGFKIHNKKIPDEAFISDDLKNIGVVVNIANGEKCERCWKISSSLKGKLCERCQSVLARNA